MDTQFTSVVYTNTAEMTKKVKEYIDNWLNLDNPFEGDTILLYGSQESDLKSAIISEFSTKVKRELFI